MLIKGDHRMEFWSVDLQRAIYIGKRCDLKFFLDVSLFHDFGEISSFHGTSVFVIGTSGSGCVICLPPGLLEGSEWDKHKRSLYIVLYKSKALSLKQAFLTIEISYSHLRVTKQIFVPASIYYIKPLYTMVRVKVISKG